VWTIREGTTFECAECGHQTSLTSGTLLEKTHKPLKMWFRAIFEVSTRRTGISANVHAQEPHHRGTGGAGCECGIFRLSAISCG
jgi:hypothetical protein